MRHARIPRPIGVLMGLFGISYMAQGWAVGEEGFSAAHGNAQLPAYVFLVAWIIWLLVSSWRTKETVEAPAG